MSGFVSSQGALKHSGFLAAVKMHILYHAETA